MLLITGGRKYISEETYNSIVTNNIVVGDSANEVYGWCYPAVGNHPLSVYTPIKDENDFTTHLRRFVYLEDYNTSIGFTEVGLPSPERVICDFLKYPKKLGAAIYIADAITGYMEDYGDINNVRSLMRELNISEDKLDYWLAQDLEAGANCGAIE